MKRFLTIFILSILFTSSAYAKIDKSYVKQIYEGCINDAKQNNDYNSDSKKFCKCYANQFNIKFNNDQLIEFLSKSDQAKAQIVETQLAPPCYPASNTASSSSKIIKLKNCKRVDREHDIIDLYYEIDLQKNSVTAVSTWNEADVKELNLDGPTQIELFPIKLATSNIIETTRVDDGYFYKKLLIHLDTKTVEVTVTVVASGFKLNHSNKCR